MILKNQINKNRLNKLLVRNKIFISMVFSQSLNSFNFFRKVNEILSSQSFARKTNVVQLNSFVNSSTNEVFIVVKINSESSSNHLKASLRIHDICFGKSLNLSTIFHHSKLLLLLDGSSCSVFLPVLDWVILLRHFETQSWVSNNNSTTNKCT